MKNHDYTPKIHIFSNFSIHFQNVLSVALMAGFVFDSPRATRERHISKIIYNVVVESGKTESYVNTNNKGFNEIEHEKNHAKTSEKRTGTSDYCSLSITIVASEVSTSGTLLWI